jgi:hypothetical protein
MLPLHLPSTFQKGRIHVSNIPALSSVSMAVCFTAERTSFTRSRCQTRTRPGRRKLLKRLTQLCVVTQRTLMDQTVIHGLTGIWQKSMYKGQTFAIAKP